MERNLKCPLCAILVRITKKVWSKNETGSETEKDLLTSKLDYLILMRARPETVNAKTVLRHLQ